MVNSVSRQLRMTMLLSGGERQPVLFFHCSSSSALCSEWKIGIARKMQADREKYTTRKAITKSAEKVNLAKTHLTSGIASFSR